MADVITVSALNRYVRSILESDAVLTDIAIRGEISNFNRNSKTGHCYFSLKDEKASVKAVMFRGEAENLSFVPRDGLRVVVRGRISLYERDGAFQVYAEFMFVDGVGDAHLAFEQLKEKLEKEGLFALEHKRSLPVWPAQIGLVTSKTGAALQDILQVAERRCPLASFLLAPVAVQGQAAQEIAQAICQLDALPEVELIIVARGGGSAEDLWVFNDERIARAAFDCETPLISAIGHEIDFCILDFVADMRAPTPSAAVEIALPDLTQQQREIAYFYTNITKYMQTRLDSCYNRLERDRQHSAYADVEKKAGRYAERLHRASDGVVHMMTQKKDAATSRMQTDITLAASLNPYAVLARGYAVARKAGMVIDSVAEAQKGDLLQLILQDGSMTCTVEEIIEEQVTL